ncbi:DNA cytosine methyltransferase [Rhodococcus qingshengii]|uniref:DNA cytosine methyltransferase n=1 Tax=Rhodococcus qingshengii TaxID=334542 RepID=UPI0036F26EAF
MAHTTRPVVVDLFSGAGGLSLGFEQAGFDVVSAVEYDPIHAYVHKFNFPKCDVVCRDVSALSGKDIVDSARRGLRAHRRDSEKPQPIDVLVGGPSCQGFSSMGRRIEGDDRNDLLAQYVRLVCEIKPPVFVLENVPGLLEERFLEFRNTLWAKLEAAGYTLTGTTNWLNASDFGVPQARKRVLIVGTLSGEEVHIQPSPDSKKITVAEAFQGLPNIELYDELRFADRATLTDADFAARSLSKSLYARHLSGVDTITNLGRPRAWDPHTITNSLKTAHTDETIRRFRETMPGTTEPVSRFYRLSLDSPARTLRAGTGRERGAHTAPRPIHPTQPRVITVREAARLHGYPDWFQFNPTNWHGHRQVGNSVPPPLGFAAGLAVLKYLGHSPRKVQKQSELGSLEWLHLKPGDAAARIGARPVELPSQRKRAKGSTPEVP